MKELRIFVVFTGGTIGSISKNGFLSPGGDASCRMLLEGFQKKSQALYEKRFQRKIVFKTSCPYEILSENLNGEHLEELWKSVKEAEGYDGIIVTTGTDTLAYSSAALGYLFADTRIPIVTVSANYPLTDKRSNGFDNFEGAMLLILEGKHKGVFCSYKNEKEHFIHYATRLLPQDNYSDQVLSVKNGIYAKVEAGGRGLACAAAKDNISDVLENEPDTVPKVLLNLKCTNLSNNFIYFQRPYPGMKFWIPDRCDALLLDTYHSGTLPVEFVGFKDFVAKAAKKKVPVFIAGVQEGLTYETIKSYQREGIFVLPQASPAAMYIKLWLLAVNGLELEKYVGNDLGNDIVP